MIKKIIYLAALSLLLSGCGDSDEPKKPQVDSMIMPPQMLADLSLSATKNDDQQKNISETIGDSKSLELVEPKKTSPVKAVPQDFDYRFSSLQQRVSAGDLLAQYELAMIYLMGNEKLPKDKAKAMQLLKDAADKGLYQASTALANLMVSSAETEDREKALALYEKGIKSGDVDAMRNAAFVLAYDESGSVLTKDAKKLEKAMNYLKDASKKGDLFADAALGELYADQGNHLEAIKWLEKPALAGVTRAGNRLLDINHEKPGLVSSTVIARVNKVLSDE